MAIRPNHEHVDNAFQPLPAARPVASPPVPKDVMDATEKKLTRMFEPLVEHAGSDLRKGPQKLAIWKMRWGLRNAQFKETWSENVQHKKNTLDRMVRSLLKGKVFDAIGSSVDLVSFRLPNSASLEAIRNLSDAEVVTKSAKLTLDGDFAKLQEKPGASDSMLKVLETMTEDLLLKKYSESDGNVRANLLAGAVAPTRLLEQFHAAEAGLQAIQNTIAASNTEASSIQRGELKSAIQRLNTARALLVAKQQEFANFKHTMNFIRTTLLTNPGGGNRSIQEIKLEIDRQLAGPNPTDSINLQRSRAFLLAGPDMMKRRWQSGIFEQLAKTYATQLGGTTTKGAFLTRLTKRMQQGLDVRKKSPPSKFLLGRQRTELLSDTTASRISAISQLFFNEKLPGDVELKKMEAANTILEQNPAGTAYEPAAGAGLSVDLIPGIRKKSFLPASAARREPWKTSYIWLRQDVRNYLKGKNSLRPTTVSRRQYGAEALAQHILDKYVEEGPPHLRAHEAGLNSLPAPVKAAFTGVTALSDPHKILYWKAYNASLASEMTPAVAEAVLDVAKEEIKKLRY